MGRCMSKETPDNWKNKYFGSLEQLEGKERQLEQTEGLMRLAYLHTRQV